MIARATAPNRIGPGSVFPDAASWDFSDGLKGGFQLFSQPPAFTDLVSRESYGSSSVLDRTFLPADHCCRVFLVLPKGAAWYVAPRPPSLMLSTDSYLSARP